MADLESAYIIGLAGSSGLPESRNALDSTIISKRDLAEPEDRSSGSTYKFDDCYAPSDIAQSVVGYTLAKCSLDPAKIDFLISCSHTPDFNNPSLAPTVLGKMNITGIGGMEIRQSAAGSIYAIDLARRLVGLGTYKCILVCATEFLARMFAGIENIEAKSEFIKAAYSISSDGAAAFLVVGEKYFSEISTPVDKLKLLHSQAACSGDGVEAFIIPNPSSSQYPLRLTPQDVVEGKHLAHLDVESFIECAKKHIPQSFEQFRSRANVNWDEIDTLVVHSPVSNLWEKLGVADIEAYEINADCGYVGAAGVPLALNKLLAAKDWTQLKDKKILLFACGAGLNWGFSLLEVQ